MRGIATRRHGHCSQEVAVIDEQERVLLRRSPGKRAWTPLRAAVVRLQPTGFSLMRIQDPLFSHWYLAAVPVVGKYTPPSTAPTQVATRHIFAVRRDRMRNLTLRPCSSTSPDAVYAWHPLTEVEGDLHVHPHELGPFLRGYLEGWIPDGVITLTE